MKRKFVIGLVVAMLVTTIAPATIYAEKNVATNGRNSFVIPDTMPILSVHDENEGPKRTRGVLPASYDSRTDNLITPIRNQDTFDTCWSFGALSAAEASYVKQGYARVDEIDFSERHLAYFFYNPIVDPLGNTVGDSNLIVNSNYLKQGGNNMFTSFALANWIGAADEAKAPYDELVDVYYDELINTSGIDNVYSSLLNRTSLDAKLAYDDVAHLQNSYWIDMKDRDDVKEMILQHGAIAISYYTDDDYFNWNTNGYYYPVDDMNHCVSVVGWDDNYSKNNFGGADGTSPLPEKDGAWLVRNSWGPYYGDNGYFWLSYEDGALNADWSKGIVYVMEPADNYDHNYQYDGSSGNCYNYLTSGGSIANVFEVKGNESGSEELKAVSFALYDVNVRYSIQVYRHIQDAKNPVSGEPALQTPITGKTRFAGYYTVPLNEEVKLSEGTKYSIVITLSKDNREDVQYFVDSTFDNGWIKFVSATTEGQSFEIEYPGDKWKDLNKHNCSGVDFLDEPSSVARIKGFTVDSNTVLVNSIALDKSNLTMKVGGEETISVTSVLPVNASDKEYIFKSSNPEVVSVDENGKVTAAGYGKTIIKAIATDGSGCEATCSVTVPYSIKYVLNGGTNVKNPTSYYEQSITLKAPTKKGYIFAGWYTNKSMTKKITKISSERTGNLTLYAKWSKVTVGTSSITSLSNPKSKQLLVKYKKISGAKGYQITYSTSSKFSKAYTKSVYTTNLSKTIKYLKKGKTYYVKVRGYKLDSTGSKVYGKYTYIKKLRIK